MGGGSQVARPTYARYDSRIRGPEIRHIYNDRLSQFTDSGEYKDVNLTSMLYHGRVDGPEYLTLEVYSPPDLSRPLFQDAVKNEFRPTRKGDSFGPSWSTHWFRVTIRRIPESWSDHERVQLEFDLPEGLVYADDGTPLQGLTGGNGIERRVDFILPPSIRSKGGPHVLYIEVSANGMFGVGNGSTIQPPDPGRYFSLNSADLVAPNMLAWRLLWDFWIIKDLSRELAQDGRESHQALSIANTIMNTFQRGDCASLQSCRALAATILGRDVDTADVYSQLLPRSVTATGYCHIDLAWLWPFAETKRKTARSWSSQCDLLDRYPEYFFTCSQAQQYRWLKQDYPKLFNRVRAKISEGRFEPIGGTWVEMDTNLPSGESLCRQFLFGQRYFEKQFGKRCKVFWLPDTFGYSSQLPQLSRLADMRFFFTQKLSWNNINDFPHTTFNWRGLDGSQVLTHMAPDNTYTAQADLGDVLNSERQHKNLTDDHNSLLVFGNGDGGGGATAPMLEKLRRCRGASDNAAISLPRVLPDSATNFFLKLERDSAYGRNLRSWVGELYFEFHRGTYTTQAKTKLDNRTCEKSLHELEYFASLAMIHQSAETYIYPREAINLLWEDVLLCQFHDVLPGSCIGMAYEDAHRMHKTVLEKCRLLTQEALSALGVNADLERANSQPLAINSLPWKRQEIVQDAGRYLTVTTDSFGTTQCRSVPGDAEIEETGKGRYCLQNGDICVSLVDGCIVSFYDKVADRELIPENGRALQYELYEDQPLSWQAWDVELFHLDKRPRSLTGAKCKILSKDSNKVILEVQYKISERSWIKSEISLDSAHISRKSPCKQLSVSCVVEWHENKVFLKVAFPTTLHANEATYDTQFGLIRRPTHFNTTWDEAKFEVCCHRFADLSEYNYGLSILNDCKYGFAVHGNTMRLSLLRAPKAPDDHADMGRHAFRFAMVAHAASFAQSDIARRGMEFNTPLRLSRQRRPNKLGEFRVSGDTNIILDTVKLAEDGDAIVIRLYECLGGRGRATLQLPSGATKIAKSAWRTNILEDRNSSVPIENGQISLALKAFEIQTYVIEFAQA